MSGGSNVGLFDTDTTDPLINNFLNNTPLDPAILANAAIEVIDNAIRQLGESRGRLGALQASSLESTATSLRISSENLRNSESRIRDTDFALESAEFTRQQTMLQAATAMLAQANQIPNRVVQLLGQ
ncbi:MAG: hypothetical protein EA402_00450 [Planctomycetota bacterium]|nr:MAG: hypothetical protein EA402_00450 [Planctomycetota bacterium]